MAGRKEQARAYKLEIYMRGRAHNTLCAQSSDARFAETKTRREVRFLLLKVSEKSKVLQSRFLYFEAEKTRFCEAGSYILPLAIIYVAKGILMGVDGIEPSTPTL